ncbi:SGNH/GDSL hydrolase family protein [Schaalia sp. ZJ1691]|uniref:SGNH/GDSL hydrolase family protein n=1 Tax=Schaalia sp. ZJ1691 TaxID=2709404 RepID=UPI0013EBBF8D|nr:SGNH/GDSL hydrolase family protein [Schaalia sp. ZJ1691]
MNPLKKTLLLTQAAIATRRVHLLPEPEGERSGIVTPRDGQADSQEPIRFVAVGDSLVAGSGVSSQAESLTPRISSRLADATGRCVSWQTHAKLGSTMRRVRYRFLEEVEGHVDVLFLCAGSNDILARRGRQDWVDDLTAAIDIAEGLADHLIVCSSGQPHNSPKLPGMLRKELAKRINAQTEDSSRICRDRGIDFVDVAHAPLFDGFWASDGFHPSAAGYEFAADQVFAAMSFLERL